MKNKYFWMAIACLLSGSVQAQVSVNTSGNPPHPSAMFEVESTSGGLLFPRMTEAQRDAISNPAPGLQIYNTDAQCMEFYTGSSWFNICNEVLCISLSSSISSLDHVSCNGAADGSAEVTAIGGASPYSYLWSSGSTSSIAPNLSGGTYTVTITDDNGCESIASATITEPTTLSATVGSNSPVTTGNDINLSSSANGGISPYSYSWSGPDAFSSSVQNPVRSSAQLSHDGTYSVTVTDANGCTASNAVTVSVSAPPFTCGTSTITVPHQTSDGISPINGSLTYGTISYNGKCWTDRNLGASQTAASATDATDASGGWYWQFNRKQGYAVGPIPSWSVTSINQSSNWTAANDPCTQLLGSDWHIPTQPEWASALSGWSNYNNAYTNLKMHTSGSMSNSNGSLGERGLFGNYWSSTQTSSTQAPSPAIWSAGAGLYNYDKAYGFTVRCIKN